MKKKEFRRASSRVTTGRKKLKSLKAELKAGGKMETPFHEPHEAIKNLQRFLGCEGNESVTALSGGDGKRVARGGFNRIIEHIRNVIIGSKDLSLSRERKDVLSVLLRKEILFAYLQEFFEGPIDDRYIDSRINLGRLQFNYSYGLTWPVVSYLKMFDEYFPESLFKISGLKESIANFLRRIFIDFFCILGGFMQEQSRIVEEAKLEVIHTLGRAAEFRDDETGTHIERIGKYSEIIAQTLGLSKEEVDIVRLTSPMHDIGKIGIPDAILLKPGRLSTAEWEIMKKHTEIGAEILRAGKHELMQKAAEIALYHHERWNGEGYPEGLKGNKIPVSARIVAICDVFDAMTSKRVYKEPVPLEKTLSIIESEKAKHFAPDVVDAFFKSIGEILFIHRGYSRRISGFSHLKRFYDMLEKER